MSNNKVFYKKIYQDALVPEKHSAGAAAYDIHSYESTTIGPKEIKTIKTGLELTIPMDCKAQIFSRSGLAAKYTIVTLGDHISPGETKELTVTIENKGKDVFVIKKGERIAQLVLLSVYNGILTEANELSETERGEKGWGSTGIL
ncbi:hypothetical protein H312_02837 [Anncaliia algerae PRA339]|uniref:Deoxyuridine 5'-triphosphate nucleotidohydrolase n=1 Tax=Anncaliia algerae PRA339 TaxID=1288291 RepID=A0A059EYD1_9MICR|nr:hypothetical protein H312_02837 [Anncaliia algerae PRA339]